MQRFRTLKVWQRSHQLVLSLYRLTERFPVEERFGLVSQLRRASVSVPANIAEGSTRHSSQEFGRFLNIAQGSLAEVEYLLLLSQDLGYLPSDQGESHLAEICEISRMLHTLRKKVGQSTQQ